MTLREAARIMVERVDEFYQACSEYGPVTFDNHAEYVAKRDAYVRTMRALIPASRDLADALKGATSADAVRVAAEAGSPQARMLEPSR